MSQLLAKHYFQCRKCGFWVTETEEWCPDCGRCDPTAEPYESAGRELTRTTRRARRSTSRTRPGADRRIENAEDASAIGGCLTLFFIAILLASFIGDTEKDIALWKWFRS